MARFIGFVLAFLALQTMGFSQSSPDFSIQLLPSEITVAPTNYATWTIEVTSIGGFDAEVTFQFTSITPRPRIGFSWSFIGNPVNPKPGVPSLSNLRFRPTDTDEITYVVTVAGVSGGITRMASATLRVERPRDSFTIAQSAQTLVLKAGPTTASGEVILTAQPVGHYNSPIDLLVWIRGGLDVTLEKTRLAPWESTRVTIKKGAGTSLPTTDAGRRGVEIRATGPDGTLVQLEINVQLTPDFEYTTGDQRVLFVPVRIKGAAQTARIDDIRASLDRIVEYYREVSYGKLRLQPDLLGEWYDTNGTPDDYTSGRRFIVRDALDAIDADVDLRSYNFYVLIVEGWVAPFSGIPFQPYITNDGLLSLAVAYAATNAPWHTIAHEIAHLFYLPDLYDHNANGIDEPFFRDWDLMEIVHTPAHFNGWSRHKLGWLPAEQVVDVQPGEKTTVILSPIELPDAEKKLIRIPRVTLPETSGRFRAFPPSFSPQRSYFLEARKRTGFDQGLPSDGVLLYTVDETMSSGSGPLRLVDRSPSTTTLSDAAFAPQPGDRSVFEDATEDLTISIDHLSDDRYSIEVESRPPGRVTLNLGLNGSGAATAKTSDGDGLTQAGYVNARLATGRPPYATAVLSLRQNGVVVSEVGVPAARPTTAARVFVDYRSNVRPPGSSGTANIYTGFAAVNRSSQTATITLTLRDLAGTVLATGSGTLAQDAHMARFVEELGEIFTGFSTPPSFPESIRFGTLELDSDQPIAVVALRLTRNQRGEILMTTVPVADLTQPLSQSSLFFPQLADGGGFATSVSLMNTSSAVQSGTLRSYRDDGSPLETRMNGASGTSFRYSLPAGGAAVFETDAGPSLTTAGWIEITPDAGHSAPVGVGLFQYSRDGNLITQSGIPAATATTRARIYVDMSGGHDTGLALANPGSASTEVRLNVFNLDGSAVATATGTIPLSGHGHSSKFVREIIPNLPNGFRGVIEIRSATPLTVLTIRSLMNTRGDFLLTTFPVADLNATASPPMLFPQIADGGGYQTEFIFLGTGESATLTLDFYGDDGRPLPIGKW